MLVAAVAAGLAGGCSEPQGAKEVPVSKREPSGTLVDPNAPTRPPAGIATH